MHPSVRAAWVDYNKNLEGILPGPYCDIDGWVTVGMGNKIDPVEDALGLPWYLLPSRRAATNDEVLAAWHAVKNDPECARRGWTYALNLPANNIRLHPDAIDALIESTLDMHDVLLRKRFASFEDWPADAQLAAHSMVWAMGFGKLVSKFPKCCRALSRGDFAGAAAECKMVPEAGTLITRNALNKQLLLNAAECVAAGGDADALVWQP